MWSKFLETIPFWSESDTERLQLINEARNKTLSSHDDVLVDSCKNYLLLSTNKGLFLISRNENWKAQLTEKEEAFYTKKGKRAFQQIRSKRDEQNTSLDCCD